MTSDIVDSTTTDNPDKISLEEWQRDYADDAGRMTFNEWQRRCPYGKWTCEDGREVIFNRDYWPILERRPGEQAKLANPNEWVSHVGQEFFEPTEVNAILVDWGFSPLPPAPRWQLIRDRLQWCDGTISSRENPWLHPFGAELATLIEELEADDDDADEDDGIEVVDREARERAEERVIQELLQKQTRRIPDAFNAARSLRERGIHIEAYDLKPGVHVVKCPSCDESMHLTVEPEGQWIRWWCHGCDTEGGIVRPRKIAGADVIPLLNMRRWDDEDAPRQEWAVSDRIPIGHVSLFSGEGGAGKSLIAQQLGVCHVRGLDWFDAPTRQGPALIIDAEDGESVIHKRLADIVAHHGLKFADVRDDLHVSSLAGKDAVLAVFDRKSGKMEPTALYNGLLEMVGDLKPVMTTLAASADFFAGDEVDRAQVRQFIQLLTRLAMLAHGAVVLISHPSLSGIASGTGLSGSTAWHNSVRSRFYLKAKDHDGEDGEPDTDLREIVFKKNNYGPVAEAITLRYRNGLFVPASTLLPTADAAARMAEADQLFLSLLRLFTYQKQDLSPKKKAGAYAPNMMASHPDAQRLKFWKHEFEEAMQRLLDQEKIHIVEDGPTWRKRSYLAAGRRTLL
jgi:RecA-family ATPase